MNLENNLQKNILTINNSISKKQNNFLNSTLWKVIDKGINTALRAALPNIIEDQIINIKDAIINNGFRARK